MRRGIQPEIFATFEEILPEHGDLEEYLQAIVTRDTGTAGNSTSYSFRDTDFGFDQAHLDRATMLSFMETQNLYAVRTPDTEQNNRRRSLSRINSLNLELDEAIALSLVEVEERNEFIEASLTPTAVDREATPTEASVPETAQDVIDPDDMTFEQLQSLEEAVGTESRGLPKEFLESFPVQKLKAKSGWFSSKKTDPEGCPICVTEFEVGRSLLTLPCLHLYHKQCIIKWLKDNKTCPICNTDLSIAQA